MPTHFSTGTKVHLATVPLASSTTITPQSKKSAHATTLVEQAEETFVNHGEILREDNVPCMGEDGRLHWIGPNSDMPFMMVQAGASLFKTGIANPPKQPLRKVPMPSRESQSESDVESSLSSLDTTPSPDETELPQHQDTTDGAAEDEAVESVAAAGRATGRPVNHLMSAIISRKPDLAHAPAFPPAPKPSRNAGPPLADFGPYGLALRVELTPKSFVPPFEPQGPAAAVDDIKIEVFFNGEFSHATLVPSRYRNEKKGSELLKHFSGLRTHYMLERAWIIRAATRDADGSSRIPNGRGGNSSLRRWQQMAASIQKEADARGFNEWNERTVMGEYLSSLAKLSMPEELQSLEHVGDLSYGVIDVVLTYGKGKKAESSEPYLLKPERMRDNGFTPRAPEPPPLPGVFHKDWSFNSGSQATRHNHVQTPNASPRQINPQTPPSVRDDDIPEMPTLIRRASQIIAALHRSPKGIRTMSRTQSFDTPADNSEFAHTSPLLASSGRHMNSSNLFSSPEDGHHTRGHIRPVRGMYEHQTQSFAPSSPIAHMRRLSISNIDPNLPQFQPAEPEPANLPRGGIFFPTEYMTALSRNQDVPPTLPFNDFAETIQQEGAGLVGDRMNPFAADGPIVVEDSQRPSVNVITNPTNAEAISSYASLSSPQGPSSSHPMLPPPLAPPLLNPNSSVETQGSLRRRSSELDFVPEERTPRKKSRYSYSTSRPESDGLGGSLGITRRGLFTQAGSPSDRSPTSLRFGSNDNINPGERGIFLSPRELQLRLQHGPQLAPINEAMPTSTTEPLVPLEDKQVKHVVFTARDRLIREFSPRSPFFLFKSLPTGSVAGVPPTDSATALHPVPALLPTPKKTSPIKPTPPRTRQPDDPPPRRSSRRSAASTNLNIGTATHPSPAPSTSLTLSSPSKYSSTDRRTRLSASPEKGRTLRSSSSPDKHLSVPSTRPRHKATPLLTNPKYARTNRQKERKEKQSLSQRTNVGLEQDFWNFEEPVGARGCVVGYAMPRVARPVGGAGPDGDDGESEGEQETRGGAGGEVVRQIKCARSGDFGEEGVLLGVRFLVGG